MYIFICIIYILIYILKYIYIYLLSILSICIFILTHTCLYTCILCIYTYHNVNLPLPPPVFHNTSDCGFKK